MLRATRSLGCLAALVAGAVALAAAPLDAAALERANRRLDNQIKLADGGGFYLVMDLEARRLDLMLQGVLLRSHPVVGIEVGRPSIAFVVRSGVADWPERVWEATSIEPPRPEVRVEVHANNGEEGPPELPEVPLPPEERVPAPSRFEIRYGGGLVLEIARSDVPARAGLRRRVASAFHSITTLGEAETRLRLRLAPEDLAALYRSLPNTTSLTFN
jgi:hypothetical protein